MPITKKHMLSLGLVGFVAGSAWKGLDVKPWGADSFRVRFSLDGGSAYNGPGTLSETAPSTQDASSFSALSADGPWTNGNLKLTLTGDVITAERAGTTIASISLSFNASQDDGSCETDVEMGQCCSGGLRFPCSGGVNGEVQNQTTVSFKSPGKSTGYFGFGEHENGKLDQVGQAYDMETCIEYSKSRGGEVCLPWVMVADDLGAGKQMQMGVLWNVGAYGSANFGKGDASTHSWTGYNLDQADLFVTTFGASTDTKGSGVAGDLLSHYVDAVGHAPELPQWASGYWHSKNRYSQQDQVLETMEIFEKNYSIPVSVFVIDYFNWAVMGNLTFDPSKWPEPKAMVDTLKGYGTKIMVSTWPFSNGKSKTYDPLQQHGWAVHGSDSATDALQWPDGVCGKPCYLYDASNPATREYWWGNIKSGYFDYGIDIFWLDAAEPEQMGGSPPGSTWSIGSMQRVGMLFPYYHSLTYLEGLTKAQGTPDGMMLSRSAWAGMSKHRAALWNGDTHSGSQDFSFLKTAIQAGLGVQMSGIAWWTTDIGGYAGGKPQDPTFRELIVRWFQFGVTCPLFRQHGARDTEPWLLGDEAFSNVRKVMALRETLRPYVEAELKHTADSGFPLNRALFFDYPADPKTWDISDQFFFGREFMVAPISSMGQRNRSVYFPAGSKWQHHFTNATYEGGQSSTVDAPMEHFPLFKKLA